MKLILVAAVAVISVICFADQSDVVKVKGRGSGETEEQALKDAYRDAVESAVGMFVDAEQGVVDNQVVKDQILTQSNAYIEDYDLIDKSEAGGRVKVKILARVKKQEITKKISSMMSAKTVSVGNSLKAFHAQETTVATRNADGLALLKNALAGIDPIKQTFDVSIETAEGLPVEGGNRAGRTRHRPAKGVNLPGPAGEGIAQFDYLFKIEVNKDRYYKELLPNLIQVLSQISIEEPRDMVFKVTNISTKRGPADTGLQRFIDPANHEVSAARGGYMHGMVSLKATSAVRGERNKLRVVTQMNDSMTLVRGKEFTLDADCAAYYNEWVKKYTGHAGFNSRRTDASFLVSFLAADNTPVAEKSFALEQRNGTLSNFTSDLIAPLISCSALSRYEWKRFEFGMEDLPKVAKIKVEMVK